MPSTTLHGRSSSLQALWSAGVLDGLLEAGHRRRRRVEGGGSFFERFPAGDSPCHYFSWKFSDWVMRVGLSSISVVKRAYMSKWDGQGVDASYDCTLYDNLYKCHIQRTGFCLLTYILMPSFHLQYAFPLIPYSMPHCFLIVVSPRTVAS
jgi:hypothetical protein